MANVNNKSKFPRIYNSTDFGLTANVTCQASQWTTIGEITVPAGQMITFGIGGLEQTDSREVCYMKLVDTSNDELPGKVRFVIADPNETNINLVAEQRTERLSASQYDKSQGFLLGEFPLLAKNDSLLQIKFYPDDSGAVTIDHDGTDLKFLIPVTVYQ